MQILVFVSSHCPHCPKAVEVISKLAKQYREYSLTYKKIRAKTSDAKMLSARYNIEVYPTILILNDDEEVLYSVKGVPSEDNFRKNIEQLLGLRKSFWSRVFGS